MGLNWMSDSPWVLDRYKSAGFGKADSWNICASSQKKVPRKPLQLKTCAGMHALVLFVEFWNTDVLLWRFSLKQLWHKLRTFAWNFSSWLQKYCGVLAKLVPHVSISSCEGSQGKASQWLHWPVLSATALGVWHVNKSIAIKKGPVVTWTLAI